MFCLLVSALILQTNILFVLYLTPRFTFLCFVLVISLFEMAPSLVRRCSLVSVPELKKAMMCLMEKINMSDKLCSGMSYSTLGHELSVNE